MFNKVGPRYKDDLKATFDTLTKVSMTLRHWDSPVWLTDTDLVSGVCLTVSVDWLSLGPAQIDLRLRIRPTNRCDIGLRTESHMPQPTIPARTDKSEQIFPHSCPIHCRLRGRIKACPHKGWFNQDGEVLSFYERRREHFDKITIKRYKPASQSVSIDYIN